MSINVNVYVNFSWNQKANETLEIEKFQSKDEPCCVYRVIPSFLRLSQNSEIENEVSCCSINFTTKFRYFVSRIWHANSKKLNQALLTSTKLNILREQNMVFWKFAICQFYFKLKQTNIGKKNITQPQWPIFGSSKAIRVYIFIRTKMSWVNFVSPY